MHRLRAQSISPPKVHRGWLTIGICVILAGLTWLVFGQTLWHDFINYDDPRYVYENTKITGGLSISGIAWAFTHIHSMNWHPLTTISHMLDCQLYGLNAGWHHFTNVLLHTLAAILLFLALQQMTDAVWRSAFVAAVFAIHPLRVESVAWIAERKDVLSGVCFMLTLLAYVCYTRAPSLRRYLAVVLVFVLGLMSKPMLQNRRSQVRHWTSVINTCLRKGSPDSSVHRFKHHHVSCTERCGRSDRGVTDIGTNQQCGSQLCPIPPADALADGPRGVLPAS